MNNLSLYFSVTISCRHYVKTRLLLIDYFEQHNITFLLRILGFSGINMDTHYGFVKILAISETTYIFATFPGAKSLFAYITSHTASFANKHVAVGVKTNVLLTRTFDLDALIAAALHIANMLVKLYHKYY